jgi:LigT like Phosphoesterase
MLAGLERPARPGLRWTPPGQWHVTLGFFAAVEPDRLVRALDAAAAQPGWAGPLPVVARCGPRPEALGGRVWILPVAGLEGLAAAIALATTGLATTGPAATGPATTGPVPVTAGSDTPGLAPAGPDPTGPDPTGPEAAGLAPVTAGRRRPFRGHLTLARARRPQALRGLPRPEVGADWPVGQVVAYRSELGHDGARHHLLGRWSLAAR